MEQGEWEQVEPRAGGPTAPSESVDEERSQRSKTDWHKVDPSFQQGKTISEMNWKHMSDPVLR